MELTLVPERHLGWPSNVGPSCSVFIDRTQHTLEQHPFFSVHFELVTPDYSLVVNRVCSEDLYVAMRGAIDALKNQAKEEVLKRKQFKSTS